MAVRLYKYFEMAVLFIGLPLLYHFDQIPGHKSLPLLIVFVGCLVWLKQNKGFSRRKLGIAGYKGWRCVVVRQAIAIPVIVAATWLYAPDLLFYLPRNNLGLWMVILVLYPLWSAYPQELIYRAFFFERYKEVFNGKWSMIIINSLLFGFLHIIFGNWIAVAGATIMGFVFAYTYSRHERLLAVAIEHAFIGDLVYTIGMGYFFYVPDF